MKAVSYTWLETEGSLTMDNIALSSWVGRNIVYGFA